MSLIKAKITVQITTVHENKLWNIFKSLKPVFETSFFHYFGLVNFSNYKSIQLNGFMLE